MGRRLEKGRLYGESRMKRLVLLLAAACVVLPGTARADVPPYVSFTDPSFAIAHVQVVDGLGGAAKRDWTVVVKDGKIAAAGPAHAVAVEPGLRVVDGRGKTVIPGIVGMHEHLYYEAPSDDLPSIGAEMLYSAPKLYLAGGVTTARTTGSFDTYGELELKKRITSGTMVGPGLDVTGPYLSGPAEPLLLQYASLSSPQDARETVNFWTARGVTSFKGFFAITRENLKATIDEAHARGAMVAGHLCAVTAGEAADMGIDELEHGIVQWSDFVATKQPDVCPPFPDLFRSWVKLQSSDPRIAALIAKLVAHHVAVTSTMAVLESDFDLAPHLSERELLLLNAESRKAYLAKFAHPFPPAPARHLLALEMAFERAFVAAGGLLTEGADAGNGIIPGFADQRAIELLVAAGFTPVEAIQVATSNGAKAMRRFDRIGSIESGKTADLVLLDGDVATNIAAIERPVMVVHAGIAYDPEKLADATTGLLGTR